MRIPLKPLRDQVIVITGASSGIGLVTAKRAAAAGAKVMLVARNREALAHAVDEIKEAGGAAAFAVADVADRAALEGAAAETVERFGRIDSWVNNAGVAIYAKLVDTPADEHERLFETNYFGVVNGCLTAIPYLRSGGALITVASIGADLPSPVIGAYDASKHAVRAYLETLRLELRADGAPIAITIVKPSGIDTPIAQHAANHGYGARQGEARVPPPVYAPELVAEAICHAAEHPRRDITVGGVGRLNVLVGTHFPRLLELVTPSLVSLVIDRSRPKTGANSLFDSSDAGRERSGVETARSYSLYTSAVLHPAATGAVLLGVLAGAAGLLARRAGIARRLATG
ncbi:MAG: SDR family NAD(P)-dependent oxidoreductase [Sphingomonadaceae bacterium]|nr:SDR family NAD(P)-dependent oxidoreductase [Sphingomonadaceae bacterium]